MAVPLTALAASPGDRLTALRAFAGAGDMAAGAAHPFDVAAVPPAGLEELTVDVGHATPGTPPAEVDLSPATLTQGRFQAALAAPAGPRDVWARACLGSHCAAASVHVP